MRVPLPTPEVTGLILGAFVMSVVVVLVSLLVHALMIVLGC